MSRALRPGFRSSAVAKASTTPASDGSAFSSALATLCSSRSTSARLTRFDQLLFAGEPPVDAPNGDSGMFGDAGDGELLGVRH